ncbi:MAG: DUF2510 domain-containing protein [Propionibacteriaceae bacterium]|jgi:hypothetical protein|nr:DUF2510 domain-containing protein [Propionibacteriaceae bacterium]
MDQPTDPGWYPDPQNSGLTRWWNGSQWTAQTQLLAFSDPAQASQPPTPPAFPPASGPAKPKRPLWKRPVF